MTKKYLKPMTINEMRNHVLAFHGNNKRINNEINDFTESDLIGLMHPLDRITYYRSTGRTHVAAEELRKFKIIKDKKA